MTSQKDKEDLLELLNAKVNQVKYNKISTLFPDTGMFRRELYPKHIEFINASKNYSQIAFIAGNRTGKTLTAAVVMTYHLTGDYPHWYTGKLFLNPIDAWCAGISTQTTKEGPQTTLLGPLEDIGSGTIPKDRIIKIAKKPGGGEAVETVYVRHVSGGTSKLTFKAYEQGWESFQGPHKHVVWLDEDPGIYKIYTECITRTADPINPGYIMCTFTPLLGQSDVYLSFVPNGRVQNIGPVPGFPGRYVVRAEWDDVPHMTEQWKKETIATYRPHEIAARTKGIASAGSGAIYPYTEDQITVAPFEIPVYWPKVYGLDVGWNKTAAVWLAQDPSSKQVYVYSEHYQGESHPIMHAAAIKERGSWIEGAIDPASMGKSQADGKALFDLYVEQGLNLSLANHAVEPGIARVNQMFASGQLKIFTICTNLLDEICMYMRDENGKIVVRNPKKDHAVDALRYAVVTGIELMSVQEDPDAIVYKDISVSGQDKITGY